LWTTFVKRKKKKKIGEPHDDGKSIVSIIQDISKDFRKGEGGATKSGDDVNLPLIVVYRRIVNVLIHSTNDAKLQLQRDGDPCLFDMLLSEETDDSELKIEDVAALSNDQWTKNSLRPFIFNLQRHMIEKTQVQIDKCILHFNSDSDSYDKTFLEYEMKSEKFCRNNEKKYRIGNPQMPKRMENTIYQSPLLLP